MKNSVEEANNFNDASVPSGAAARQARENRTGKRTETLASRFVILKQVGASAIAQFYLAREHHKRPDETVMLKILHQDAAKDPTELVSFLLESRAAARLSHDNIIKTGAAEQIGSIHFYIIEHKPDAETLREMLNQRGWLDVDRAIELADQVADALKCAHESGILHLKVEPNNILLTPDAKVTLTGFGVDAKKQFEWVHRKRTLDCPFAYLSPEQLDNSAVDQRSDLYSLGVTLYEALTDRLPFNAENVDQIKQKISSQKVQPPHLFRLDIPEALSGIVMRLIAKNPAERFQDAAALKSALANLLNPVSRLVVEQNQSLPKAIQHEAIQPEPTRSEPIQPAAIQDESDYTRTQELASLPARTVKANDSLKSHQSLAQVNEDGTKAETDQPARFDPPSITAITPPQEIIREAQPVALQPKRTQSAQYKGTQSAEYAPSIKTFYTFGAPASLRLAIFALILVAVAALSFFAYRYRLTNRIDGAQASGQSMAGATGTNAESNGQAPGKSNKNKPESDQPPTDGQPNALQQHQLKSDSSNAIPSSTGLESSLRPEAGSPRASAGQRQTNSLRRPKAARRGSRNKVRVRGRNIHRR